MTGPPTSAQLAKQALSTIQPPNSVIHVPRAAINVLLTQLARMSNANLVTVDST